MSNHITKKEREALIREVGKLLANSWTRFDILAKYQKKGISRQRILSAIARARMRANRLR